MLRLTLLTVLLALALTPTAYGQVELERALAAGGQSLSLEEGRGFAAVTSRAGAMFARVGRGRIVVTNYVRGPRTERKLWGCNTRKRIGRRTVVCSGRKLSLSIVDGRWRVVLRGTRIDASAVLQGSVTLKGTSGTYSIDGDDPRPWPSDARTFRLG